MRVVHAIAHVNESVVRERGAVHGPPVLCERLSGIVRLQLARSGIDRRLAVGAPHPLERALVGVIHDDAAVAVAVGHVDFIGRHIDFDFGGSVQVRGVEVAFARAVLADLQQELAVLREFQNGVAAVAGEPHVVFAVDRDAVHRGRPFVAGARRAPVIDELPSGSNSRTGGAAEQQNSEIGLVMSLGP